MIRGGALLGLGRIENGIVPRYVFRFEDLW